MKSLVNKQVAHKYLHLIVLLIILGLSSMTFIMLNGKRDLQLLIGLVSALTYILWGIIFHLIERDLYPRVIVEYVGIATVGLVLLYTVLFI